MSPAEKKASIDPANDNVSIRTQCQLIGLSRSSVYYQPRPIRPKQLELMKRVDELFTLYPIYGTRQLQFALRAEGWKVSRRRIARIMRKLGLEAIYKKPNTSKPNPAHPAYPCILTCLKEKRSASPTRSGARTSPTSPSTRAFCTWLPSWIGPRARSWLGG